jgi:GNAT superfamily N-acetyltransferase
MDWQRENYRVSDCKEMLQLNTIYRWLSSSYWASDRNKETVKASIDQSLCFGLFDGEQQIGFARAVTDKVVFSWLMDVIIDEKYRGQGLGQWFLQCILEHPDLKATRMGLTTKDAHTFYEKFNFVKVECMRQPISLFKKTE